MLGLLKRLFGWDTDPDVPAHIAPKAPVPRLSRPQKPHAMKPAAPPPVPEHPGSRELSLDAPAGDGFDPYNTGVFDRSASWDRIRKSNR